jgi:cytoskeletal protein CcmA (bactofilin family)
MRIPDSPFGRKDPLRSPLAPGRPLSQSPVPAQPLAAVPRPPPPAPAVPDVLAADPVAARLVVGPNIKLKGVEIDDCDTLVVEGRVEATIACRSMQIAESGAYKGNADLEDAEVRGSFEGELTVRGRLVVHSPGRVSGKVRYGRLLVQEGGEISGDIGAAGRAG